MIMKKTFSLGLWSEWDDGVARAAEFFRDMFEADPNVLVANTKTLRRINTIAEKTRSRNGYTLRVDERLSDGQFSLLNDLETETDEERVTEVEKEAETG